MQVFLTSIPKLHVAILLGLIGLVYLPVLLGETWFLDVYLTEVYPHHILVGNAFSQLELPFWTQQLMMGYPLAYNPQVGAFYPVHAILLPFLDAHILLSWSVFFHGCIGGLGVYVLARMATATEIGSLIAGATYALCPFFVFYHQAVHGFIVLSWMPWAIVCTWKAAQESNRRWLAGAAMIVAMQMYAGHLQFVLYTLLLMGIVAVYGVPKRSLGSRLLQLGWTIASSFVALALYAPQLFAAITLWQHSLRKSLTSSDVTEAMAVESLGLDDLVEVVLPQFFGGPSLRDFWYPEFLGIAVILSATIALYRRRAPQYLGWTCFGAIVYLMAIQSPGLGELITSIPGLSAFRAPGRILCWLILLAAILAGTGFESLLTWLSTRPGRITSAGIAGIGLAIATGLMHGVAPRDPELPNTILASLRTSDGWMLVAVSVGLLLAGLLYQKAVKYAAWILASCIIAPLLHVSVHYSPSIDTLEDPPFLPLLRGANPNRVLGIATGDPNYLASVPGPESWPHNASGDPVRAGWSLHANVGASYGFSNLHGQTSLPLRRVVHRIFGPLGALEYPVVEHPPYHAELLAHLGVTHIVSRRTGQMPVTPRPPAIGEVAGYAILQVPNPRPLARFYPNSGVQFVGSEKTAIASVRRVPKVNDLGYPIEWPLIVEAPANISGLDNAYLAPSDVTVKQSKPGMVTLAVDAPTDGIVLYTEAWFPEWRAYVDGTPTDIVVADGCFIGVPLQAGQHRIELRLEPSAWRWGIPFIGLGVFGLVGLWWRREGRQQLTASTPLVG